MNINLIKKIQVRLAAITCNLPHHKKHVKPPKPPCDPKPTVKDLIAKSTHSFADPLAVHLKCTICDGMCSLASSRLRTFLANECVLVSICPSVAIESKARFVLTVSLHTYHTPLVYVMAFDIVPSVDTLRIQSWLNLRGSV